MEKFFTEDDACRYTQTLWLKIAHFLSDKAMISSDPIEIVKIAMLADACYWHATGTQPAINIQEFITQEYK